MLYQASLSQGSVTSVTDINIACHQNRLKKVAAVVATASVHDVALAPHPRPPGAQQHEIIGHAPREQSKLGVQGPCRGDKCGGGKMRNACSNAKVRKISATNKKKRGSQALHDLHISSSCISLSLNLTNEATCSISDASCFISRSLQQQQMHPISKLRDFQGVRAVSAEIALETGK